MARKPLLEARAGICQAGKRKKLTWAQRLKQVFNIDIAICHRSGGTVKMIGCIEDPAMIRKILDYRNAKASISP